LAVPLILKEELIGLLSISWHEPDHFTSRQAELVLALAGQAVAIGNARLYGQAQTLAALQERQRLARKLHDSVSQMLYSIALSARTARILLDRDPTQVGDVLDDVLGLAKAGLAEMRALISELRPESLETEGIVAALTKQAASLRVRHDLEAETDLCPEPDLPLETKEELYRIAQEALHNIVKHARASRISLRLADSGTDILLEVGDNGIGFDPAAPFPGHLGL
jgi:signal transduction histidine kinase